MTKRFAIIILVLFAIAACQPTTDEPVPTLAVLPSATLSLTPSLTFTPAPTTDPVDITRTAVAELNATVEAQAQQTATERAIQQQTAAAASDTPTPTHTLTPTETLTPTATPDVLADFATSTAAVIEAPRLSTFTPIPLGVTARARPTSTGTPQLVADVVITEAQFQEEIDRLIADNDTIQDAVIDFMPGGVNVRLTALGGQAFTTGDVFITFDLVNTGSLNNVLQIQPVPPAEFVMSNNATPSETFITVAYQDMFPLVLEAFDFILNQRLGQGQHDLEFIIIDGRTMAISLLARAS